jgi:hypothetical protein
MSTKQEHLKLLAKYYLSNLIYLSIEYGCWGLDPKRPFGNSNVEKDILNLLNIKSEFEDEYSTEQLEYAAELYKELGSYLKQIGENL